MKRPAVTLLRFLLMQPPGGAMAPHAGTGVCLLCALVFVEALLGLLF